LFREPKRKGPPNRLGQKGIGGLHKKKNKKKRDKRSGTVSREIGEETCMEREYSQKNPGWGKVWGENAATRMQKKNLTVSCPPRKTGIGRER